MAFPPGLPPAAFPAPPARPNTPTKARQSLRNGQLRQVFNVFTQPLVVQALDAAGRPIAKFSRSPGPMLAASTTPVPRVVNTDANGLPSLQFVPNGDFGPGIAYRTAIVVASSSAGTAVFTVVSYPVLSGSFDPQPDVLFLKPAQDSRTFTAKSGATLNDAVPDPG